MKARILVFILINISLFQIKIFGQTNIDCSCHDMIYLNDTGANPNVVHKFEVNPTNGDITEIGNPWLVATGVVNFPHGVAADLNGYLYISQASIPNFIGKFDCAGNKVDADPSTIAIDNFVDDIFGYDFFSIGNYLYINAVNTTTGNSGEMRIYDLCTGDMVGCQYPTLGWSTAIGPDGYWYEGVGHTIRRGPLDPSTFTIPCNTTVIEVDWMTSAQLGLVGTDAIMGIDFDSDGYMYGAVSANEYEPPSRIIKIDPVTKTVIAQSLTDSSIDANDNDGLNWAGARGLIYSKEANMIYVSTLDDCVAGFDTNLNYVPGASDHTRGDFPKQIGIVTECCPAPSTSVIDTILCGAKVGDHIFLQDVLPCNGIICEGSWTQLPGSIGLIYNECDLSIEITSVDACGSFSLTSTGSGANNRCGAFSITLNISIEDILTNTITGNQTMCSGGTGTAITSSVTATEPVSYQWQMSTVSCSSGFTNIAGATANSYTPSGFTQTTYIRLIAKINSDCNLGTCQEASNCVTINIGTEPSVVCSQTNNSSCSTPNGTATATAMGVTYLWSNSATTSSISGLSNGTYTVTVTDTATGCTNTCQAVVGSTTTLPTATCASTNNTNCATPNGTASVTTNANQILWSNGGTTATISNLSAGTYTVTVTNTTTGCTNTCQSVVATTTTLPTATCSKVDNTNCATPNGSASVVTNGNQILWSNGGTTATISNLSAGTYTVTVTNTTTGCTNTCQAVVATTTTLPTATCSKVDNTNCATPNGSASVVTNGNQILWSNGGTTATISNLSAGTYTVTVTNTTTGCTNTCQSVITNNTTLPPVTCAKVDNTNCSIPNGSATATATGVTYLWSNGGTTATISNLSAGTYTVTVTSTTTACTNTCQAIVGSTTTPPTATCSKVDNTNCSTPNGSASVVTNGNQILWSNGGITATISNLSAGTYTVTVTNTTTGCTNTCQAVVGTTTTLPTATCSKVDNTNCASPNGSASVVTDGDQIMWSNGGTTATINNLTAGTYTVTVTNTTTGCTNTCQAVVANGTVTPTCSVTINSQPSCASLNGGSVTVVPNPAGTYTYVWSEGSTTATVNNLAGGTYSVTVTNTTTNCTGVCTQTLDTPTGCCPTFNDTQGDQEICETTCIQYSFETDSPDPIDLVYFTSPASDPYVGGTYFRTLNPMPSGGGGYIVLLEFGLPGVPFDVAPGTYYMYGILTNTPTDPSCRPSVLSVIVVDPLPQPTLQTICTPYPDSVDLQITIPLSGQFDVNITSGNLSVNQLSCGLLDGGGDIIIPQGIVTLNGNTAYTIRLPYYAQYYVRTEDVATNCHTLNTVDAPASCCEINGVTIQSIECIDNGTPGLRTDNKLRFYAMVINTNALLSTYNVTVNGGTTITPNTNVAYGFTQFTLGPGSAGGGTTFTVTVTDSLTPGCTQTFQIIDPGTCEPATQCPTPDCGNATIQVNGN